MKTGQHGSSSNRMILAAGACLFILVVSARAQTVPTAPTNLVADTVSASQIDLSWSDNSSDEDGFKIERTTDGTNFVQIAQLLPDTTVYRNTGLWPGTTNYYRVRAYNVAGDSDCSNVAGAVTPALCLRSIVGWGWNMSNQVTVPPGITGVVAIAVGYHHNVVLLSNRTVVAWGDSSYGATTPPDGLTDVSAVSAGIRFSLALKSDGTVVGWGANTYGQSSPPAGLSNVVAVSAGIYHGLALKSDGTVVGWGRNTEGEATPPAGLVGVVAVSAGLYHSLALKSDGTLVGWGSNTYGQAAPPVGLTGVIAIAASHEYSLALKSDGTVVGWGYDLTGRATPPVGLSNVVAIAGSNYHALALKSDGAVVGWGSNSYGASTPPAGLQHVITIGAGGYDSLVLTTPCDLSVPSALVAVTVSSEQINLSWVDNAAGEDGFLIERALDSGGAPGAWVQIATIGSNVTAYSDTGLVPGVYWYRIRAYNQDWHSCYSNPSVATVLSPPPAPSSLAATVGSTSQINLSWVDNSSNEDGFKIERSTDGTNYVQIAQVLPGTTTYRDTGLWPGTTYYYRVRAYVGVSESDSSNVPNVVTPALCSTSVVGWGWNYSNKLTVPPAVTGVVALAVGYHHNLALKEDRTVVGWGDNTAGAATPPAGLTGVTALAVGLNFSLALKSDGTIVGWGSNAYSQSSPPAGLSNVVAVAAGQYHGLALTSKGTVVGWGYDYWGQASPPAGLVGVVAIAAGSHHSLALRSDGTVVGWGYDSHGETTPPAGLTGVIAVSAGYEFSLALKSDGTVVGWGLNSSGQSTPPAGLSNVVAIAAGYWHSVALQSDTTVVAWGSNYSGAKTPPAGLRNVIAIGAGTYHSLALTSPCVLGAPSTLTATPVAPGQINLSWTDNATIEDGFKIERATENGGTPGAWIQVGTVGSNVTAYSDMGLVPAVYWYRVCANIAGGHSYYSNLASASIPEPPAAPSNLTATAVSSSQIRLSWIDNSNNEDGFKIERSTDGANFTQIARVLPNNTMFRDSGVWPGTTYYYRVRAHTGVSNSEFTDVASATTLDLCSAPIVAWGLGTSGQTTPPAGATGVVTIAAGGFHSLALNTDHSVISWGDNSHNQTTVPAGLTDVVAVAAGYYHSLALKSDGTVVGWGWNESGQTTPPAGLSNVVAIAAGYYHSVALKSDGSVVGWGNNTYQQSTSPAGATGVVAIATGYSHNLALKSDGRVIGWGQNNYGQATPPAGATGAVAIAAGAYHSLALKSNGTVVGWGINSEGEATPPAGLSNVVAIAAGGFHSLALKDDGTVVGWGVNNYGQTTTPAGLAGVAALAVGTYHSLALCCAPSAASVLTASAVSTTRIDLQWTDNSADEVRFGIERAAASAGPWSEIGSVDSNVTVYSDFGAGCGQTYYYRVRSYNATAGSLYSNTAGADTSHLDTDGDGIPDCWTQQYFGHPTGEAADNSRASDDPDSDGFSNLQEYLIGTDPTDSASALRITDTEQEGDDVRVTWTAGSGKTNALQATAGDADGDLTNDFNDVFIVTNTAGSVTNYLDLGAATNFPSRYYRIRLVP